MGEISSDNFFETVKKEIEKDNNINKEVKELIKATDFDLKKYFENCEDINVAIPILQKTNEYFLKNYEIHLSKNLLKLDKDLIIKPIETEIYFANSNGCLDGMCHRNILQKGENRFGKLYFHTYKKNISKPREEDKIDTLKGGIDVCISNGEYSLSILIRGAYINGELFCGINKIMQRILKIEQGKEVTRKNLNGIEEKKVLFSREDNKNYKYFIYQNRIIKDKYSIDGMPLNIIINDKEIFDKIDKNEGSISSSVRTHYRDIKAKDFESEKNILISFSLKSIIHSIL